ncbi:hypothetical protein SERLADRAFT_456541 [Serpula lacrymans var. lacrymans S7.9]|uniref:Uncharacterized protein n=1 Tax=Serpula lacrymans var. lacrymans (strain S7.9) TaxID=578457 RepID=F8NHJ0_SERL9|nr:uncharacterized protein SERLADRAFT_456541 [Serpula lacrymans var. lacrymans S7.9]EGO29161.1 hypothetical protein SERLADRAFT_456541 [Serpula lacrymans var. lacrymans S7.9]
MPGHFSTISLRTFISVHPLFTVHHHLLILADICAPQLHVRSRSALSPPGPGGSWCSRSLTLIRFVWYVKLCYFCCLRSKAQYIYDKTNKDTLTALLDCLLPTCR